RHVAAGEAGAAGGDDDVDGRIGDPGFDLLANPLDVVGDDLAAGDDVPRALDPLGQDGAGLVIGKVAGVGHGQHRDFQRDELPALIDARHGGQLLVNPRCGGDNNRVTAALTITAAPPGKCCSSPPCPNCSRC